MTEPDPSKPPRVVDRRPIRRKRVLLRGRVSYAKGAHHFDCTIRDLSERGARISFTHDQLVPSNIHFINLHDRTAHEAIVVWNRGREMGLKFVRSFPQVDLMDPSLSYLKRLLS